jgi:hypothetical protein
VWEFTVLCKFLSGSVDLLGAAFRRIPLDNVYMAIRL